MLKEQEHAGTLMLMAGEHKNKQSSTVYARQAPTAPKKMQIIIYIYIYIS